MDSLSKRQERALAITGVVVVVGGLLLVDEVGGQLIVALLGVFLAGAGGWGTIPGLLPDRRQHVRLREETEILLEQVRALDELAAGDESLALARQRQRMHEQVERVVDVAGIDD